MRRRVAPLVGAGVSVPNVPTAERLAKALNRKFYCEPFADEKNWATDEVWRAALDTKNSGPPPFSRIGSIANWLRGADWTHRQLVKLARLESTTPTRAHRYLALLAREDLIQEVITTNYDCGIETAWLSTFGAQRPRGWAAIASPAELRRRPDRPGQPWLNLYKINGCASRVVDSDEGIDPDHQLIMTERQLQHFGARRWARRVLMNCLSRYELLLCGFTSAEHQVRHAIMDILEEHAQERDRSHHHSRLLWLALYDQDTLPFHLLEALVAEHCAVQPVSPDPGDADIRTPMSFENVFWKSDAGFMDPGGARAGLDAGAFWRVVWLECLRERIRARNSQVTQAFCDALSSWRAPGDEAFARNAWQQICDHVWPSLLDADSTGPESIDWLAEPVEWTDHGSEDARPAPGIANATTDRGSDCYLPVLEYPKHWMLAIVTLLGLRVPSPEGRRELTSWRASKNAAPRLRVRSRNAGGYAGFVVTIGRQKKAVASVARRDDSDSTEIVRLHKELHVSIGLLDKLEEMWSSAIRSSGPETFVQDLADSITKQLQYRALDTARALDATRRNSLRRTD